MRFFRRSSISWFYALFETMYRLRYGVSFRVVLAQGPVDVFPERRLTQESIGRLQRVKLKQDVNGLEGRVKP